MTDGTSEQYRVATKLGEGGVGEVYLATDTLLGRTVAVKRLRPELAAKPHIVQRFRSEAQTLAQMNHPNVAMLYGLHREGDTLLMVMEYVEGESIHSLIGRSGPLALEPAMAIFLQTLQGIGYVHAQGVVHRDIKGGNLMLGRDGLLKVMDFGIARALGSERLTKVGQLVGTPEFMPPEQIRGEEPDRRSDIYSLGILLYLLLAGRVPFDANGEYGLLHAHVESEPFPLSQLTPGLPEGLDAVALRAIAKHPADRYESVEAFRTALLSCLPDSLREVGAKEQCALLAELVSGTPPAAGEAVTPTRVQQAAPTLDVLDADLAGPLEAESGRWLTAIPLDAGRVATARPRRRRRWLRGLALAALLAIALAGVNWLWLDRDSPPARVEGQGGAALSHPIDAPDDLAVANAGANATQSAAALAGNATPRAVTPGADASAVAASLGEPAPLVVSVALEETPSGVEITPPAPQPLQATSAEQRVSQPVAAPAPRPRTKPAARKAAQSRASSAPTSRRDAKPGAGSGSADGSKATKRSKGASDSASDSASESAREGAREGRERWTIRRD